MSERNNKRRRFIAGAVCPECRVVDRMVVVTSGTDSQRECVQCGYHDNQPLSGSGGVPRGRAEKPADRGDEQAVRIVVPRPPE